MINKIIHDGFFYVVKDFDEHIQTQTNILNLIDENSSDTLVNYDSYFTDNIDRLDWSLNTDFSRPWVNVAKPLIESHLLAIADSLGYKNIFIDQIWFQQYIIGNSHGWHTHGSNFTGVYYLELPEDAPKTQLLNPVNQEEIIVPEIEEGKILIFPSYVIHRAPFVNVSSKKTIISFNFNFSDPKDSVIDKIKNLAD
jgi:hypothetical protein